MHSSSEDYRDCRRCGLWRTRRSIVFGSYGKCSRGTVERDGKLLYWRGELDSGLDSGLLPISIVPTLIFIGEAPGKLDDITGRPFMGESGRLFNYCLSKTTEDFDFFVTHTVACRPSELSKRGSVVNRKPTDVEIKECRPRVKSLLPKFDGIVYVGDVANNTFNRKGIKVTHPKKILRREYKAYDIKLFSHKIDQYVKTIRETWAGD